MDSKADNQCFAYDAHRRMTEAWTPKSADCAASGRTTANLDGAAPYWTSYTYNSAGQRSSETTHTATGDATTGYEYRTPAGQPHPLVKTTGAKAATYGYDLAGNTTTRPGTQANQTLAWNSEGALASTTEPAAGTKPALGTGYLYDADGELLIRRATGDGDTVLYLKTTEVRLTVKGTTKTVTGTRYYSAAGQTLAVRAATSGTTGTKLNFLAADHHGTSSIATDATTQAVTKRYSTPFGAPRGTKPTAWPDDKTFLGKPTDSATGLTHIGARAYDPGIGQFISVDPLLEIDKHQTLNGYSYAGQAPATNSDPTGTCLDPGNGRCQPGDNSGKPDPSFPTNSSSPPGDGGPGYNGTAPSGGSGGTNGSGGGGGGGGTATYSCVWTGQNCVLAKHASGPTDTSAGDAIILGLISNVVYASEYFAWPVDSSCMDVENCTYGEDFDAWVSGQGIDTSGDSYLVPGTLASVFAVGKAGRPKYNAKNPPPGGWKLSHQNPLMKYKQLRETYGDVSAGAARQRRNPDGSLDFYRADGLNPRQRGKWKDSKIYTVPGKENHRILVRPDGKIGYAFGHDYDNPRLFPAPWYKDGGEYPGGLK